MKPTEQERIKAYGATCRELADKGERFTRRRAFIFKSALRRLDFDVCQQLIDAPSQQEHYQGRTL